MKISRRFSLALAVCTRYVTAFASANPQQHFVEESMPIVGSSIRHAMFGGVPYWDTSAMKEFRVCFVLGGPGAGKGTQSTLLQQHYPCVHLSVGELLRQETSVPNSPHGALIESCLVSGKIVPVEISLALLQKAMNNKSVVYLVDGFPRNFDNLDGWNRCMQGVASVWGVLMYSCPLRVLEERILARAATSGRSDDNVESAQRRFHTFARETLPVVDVLRRVGETQTARHYPAPLHIADIAGDQSLERVWQDTQHTMDQFVAHDVWTANARLLQAVLECDAETYRSLCAPELLLPAGPLATMQAYEAPLSQTMTVCQAKMEFVTGTRVLVSYHRTLRDNRVVRETRIWSHQGNWVQVHFTRTPIV